MTLSEFAGRAPELAKLGPTDQLRIFAWYLHTYEGLERVTVADFSRCFDGSDLHKPAGLHQLVKQIIGKDLIKDAKGLRLAKGMRDTLDGRFGNDRDETVLVDQLLSSLPSKLTSAAQQDYLNEALVCFRHKAFRAAIVMTWNVAYDHLLSVVVDSKLAAFNAQLATMLGGKRKPIVTREDFQRMQESDIIDVCNAGRLVSKEVAKVLKDKLDRRNSAAHPSGSTFNKLQAEEFITDLVNNALLKVQ